MRSSKYQRDDPGQLRDVHCDDRERRYDIPERHERHDDLREVGDALDAAEDDKAEYRHDDDGRREFRKAEFAGERIRHLTATECQLGGVANGIRLDAGQQQARPR